MKLKGKISQKMIQKGKFS